MRELATYIEEGFFNNVNTKEVIVNAKLAALFDNKPVYKWLKELGIKSTSFVAGTFLVYLIMCCFLRHKDLNPTILVVSNNTKEIFLKRYNDIYDFNITPAQRVSVRDIDLVYKQISQESRNDYETEHGQGSLDLFDWIIANGKKYNGWFLVNCHAWNGTDYTQSFIKVLDALNVKYFEVNVSKSGHAGFGKRLIVQDIFELIK